MSAKEKQVLEIEGKLDDITECPICKETYKEPKILSCLHTFCLICIKETGLKTNSNPGDKMPCPVCRKEFIVPEKGFAGLQRNFFMERLIEMKNILSSSSESVLCDACQEDNDLGVEVPPAAMYCADCNQRMCEECCKNHRKYKATKNHRMLQLDGALINIPSIAKQYVCDKHENKQLDIYCSSCQEAICALCFFDGHKTHETLPVVNVSSDFRRVIKENSDSMLSFILDLKNKVKEEDNGKVVFARKVAAVESEIKATRQNLQECIEKHCDSLLQQLNSIKQEQNKKSESQLSDIETVLASLVSYQAYCKQVTAIGSDVDICREVYNLNRRAAELKERYDLLSSEPFPNIWLKKPEFHDAFLRAGNNIIGKIEG